jgi:hypothetical protein
MFEVDNNIHAERNLKHRDKKQSLVRKSTPPVPIDRAFRSIEMSWIIFLFILLFNILVFNKAFLKVIPTGISNTNAELDAIIYGLGNGLLLAKILFHQNWNKAHLVSAGPVAIYFNALFLLVHLDFFNLGTLHTAIMKLLLVIMPVIGLMSMIITLSNSETND